MSFRNSVFRYTLSSGGCAAAPGRSQGFKEAPGITGTRERTRVVVIEQDEDGVYVAKVPAIAGRHTQGRTIGEAVDRIREAISACGKDGDARPLRFIGMLQIRA